MNSNSSMQNVNSSGQATAPASGYAPSVPISLYREVTAELQATKTAMESIKNQNQQLAKQNQQLRQEIEKAAQSALKMQQVAEGLPVVKDVSTPVPRFEVMPEVEVPAIPHVVASAPARPAVAVPARQTAAARPLPKAIGIDSPFPPEKIVYEQDSKPRRKILPDFESSSEPIGGWWLGVAIAMIVVTAFGAGFLIVRPLLPSASPSK